MIRDGRAGLRQERQHECRCKAEKGLPLHALALAACIFPATGLRHTCLPTMSATPARP